MKKRLEKISKIKKGKKNTKAVVHEIATGFID